MTEADLEREARLLVLAAESFRAGPEELLRALAGSMLHSLMEAGQSRSEATAYLLGKGIAETDLEPLAHALFNHEAS